MREIERKINIMLKIMETSNEIFTMRKNLTKDEKAKSICDKIIRQNKKAIRYLPSIRHEDIINSLYNSFVTRAEGSFFGLIAPVINHKNTHKWDNSEEGYKEFLELEEEAKKIAQEKAKEREEKAKMFEEAKARGDKVEMLYNPKTKKIEPIITKKEEEDA